MPRNKLPIVRRVRGTRVTFDSMGKPKAIHTNRGPREMEEARKRQTASMLSALRNATLQERDIVRSLNEQSGNTWEIHNEDDGSWNNVDIDLSQDWVQDEEPEHIISAINGIVDELQQSNDENINVDIGAWSKSKRVDHRTRADRLIRQQEAWRNLNSAIDDAYLKWDSTGAPPFDEKTYQGEYHSLVKVLDLFECRTRQFPWTPGIFIIPTMIQYGYLGNAPIGPSCAFSFQMLELFRVMNSRCPQFSIQRFIRGICDLQQTAYSPSLRNKFSSTFDVYLQIIARISQRLQTELGRNMPDWRLKNACPACTFKTPDEPAMKYSMLIALDGNNSLRRMPKAIRKHDENGRLIISEYTERLDNRSLCDDLYLANDYVDCFKNEVKKSSKSASTDPVAIEGSPTDGVDQPTPCVERWTNLAEESSKKMWGVFHETGIFLAACRHGTALLICDMVRSGELAKYPLSLLNKLIDAYGANLLIGYDIGCGFSSTAARSPKVGPRLSAAQTRFCVGSFHGHAHCRTCQLDWHPLHVEGSGIEDFETCERVFSESNNVAGPTRHASTFHRRQAILNHFVRWNLDKYAELSQFIMNNYRQSLQIICDNTSALAKMMKTLNLTSTTTFVQWLNEEKVYLSTLKKPVQSDRQSLSIEYVQTLKKLEAARVYFEVTSREWIHIPLSTVESPDFYPSQSARTQTIEAARLDQAHARGLDTVLTLQAAVRNLEIKLNIEESKRWTPESPEWAETEVLINRAEYQSIVDKLEGLVVSRLFELSKLNQSGLGVKLRTHIAKALKARSKAIRNVITEYNTIAPKFQRPVLDIQTVLEYVSIGEFDLLRESQYDPTSFPWMRSAERAAGVLYFKLERAQEEIIRLNVEIKRLYLFMQTEEKAWKDIIAQLENTQPFLASQAAKRLKHLVSLNEVHELRLAKLTFLDGYSGPTLASRIHVGTDEDEGNISDDNEAQSAIDTALSFVDRID